MSLPQHPVTPRATAGSVPLTPFVLLGALWAAIAECWLAWACGRLVAAVAGHHPGPAFGSLFARAVIAGDWDTAFPGLSHPAIAVLFSVQIGVVVVVLFLAAVWWQRHRSHTEDALPSLARVSEMVELAPAGITARAQQLRPSLTGVAADDLHPDETGLPLGELLRARPLLGTATGPVLRASWEDVILALMGPRAGKTTALAVPMLLAAPGPALATSNKADLWAATHTARARTGRVWVFDPQAITRVPRSWWWDPIASVTSVEDAARLAGHFLQPIRHGKTGDDFWIKAAEDLLASLFLAAAASTSTLNDVQAWLADAADEEPVQRLHDGGWHQTARALRGRQRGAPETRDGIWETARTAAACLQDPVIMAWVTPPARPDVPRFDPDAFPVSSDTLLLLSKDGAGSSAPLVAALTDQVLRHGIRRAEERGGRLDPPLVAVLDEAANICPIADLPLAYSHFGSRGICAVTVLQNYAQGTGVWGRGMDTLWAAATIKLIGAGIDDPRFTADVSTLVGEHDVSTLSISRDPYGTATRQVSTRRQRILGPEHLRGLQRGTALLLASGTRPALLRLRPWFAGPRAAELAADTAASIRLISDAAEGERLARDLAGVGVPLIPPGDGSAPPPADPPRVWPATDEDDGSDGGPAAHGSRRAIPRVQQPGPHRRPR